MGDRVEKDRVRWLTNCPSNDSNFKWNIARANIPTLKAALAAGVSTKSARQKVESRLRRLLRERQRASIQKLRRPKISGQSAIQNFVDDSQLFALCPQCSGTIEVLSSLAQQYIERHGCQKCRDAEFDRDFNRSNQASPATG